MVEYQGLATKVSCLTFLELTWQGEEAVSGAIRELLEEKIMGLELWSLLTRHSQPW
jgi:hypothetical protein